MVVISESRPCQYRGTKASWLMRRKKVVSISPSPKLAPIPHPEPLAFFFFSLQGWLTATQQIVDKALVSPAGVTCLESGESHHSIASCSAAIRRDIVGVIQSKLKTFQQSRGLRHMTEDAPQTNLDNVKIRERESNPTALQASLPHAALSEATISRQSTQFLQAAIHRSTRGISSTITDQRYIQRRLHYIDFPPNPHFVGRRDILHTLRKNLVGDDNATCASSTMSPSSTLASAPPIRRAFALWAPQGVRQDPDGSAVYGRDGRLLSLHSLGPRGERGWYHRDLRHVRRAPRACRRNGGFPTGHKTAQRLVQIIGWVLSPSHLML